MKKRRTTLLCLTLCFVLCSLLPTFAARAQSGQTGQPGSEKKMTLTGTIAKVRHSYVIRSRRGEAPSEVYTILNARPAVLDQYVKKGTPVQIRVRVVTGDNVKIEAIEGKAYPQFSKQES